MIEPSSNPPKLSPTSESQREPLPVTTNTFNHHKPASNSKGSFWNRHSALINFWLDVVLLILFVVQAWLLAVIHVVFPRGAGPEWTIWGATPLDWSEALFAVFCLFAVAVILHVMFHWAWVCGIVATRILRQKAGKDDGTHTLIGVGLLVLLIHLVILGVLVTRASLVHVN